MRLDHLLSGKQLQLFRWMLTLLAKLSDLGAAGAKTAFKIERPHLSVVGTSQGGRRDPGAEEWVCSSAG